MKRSYRNTFSNRPTFILSWSGMFGSRCTQLLSFIQGRPVILPARFALLLVLLLIYGHKASANAVTTPASASVCGNYASTGATPKWTTLGTMAVTEGNNRDMGRTNGSWSITLVLAAPTGWQFNNTVNPTLGFTASRNITSVTRGTFTSTSISITIAGAGKNLRDAFTITGLQVQPTSTSAANGNIKYSSKTGTLAGVGTSTNFGTLTRVSPTAGAASVSVAASPSTAVCSGTNITFVASVSNGGTSPTYQWKLNGANISGATNYAFSTSALTNGNIIACSVASSSCIVTPTATSANYTATVTAAPSVSSFSVSSPFICESAGATPTITSTSLGTGTFTVTYGLSGANNSTGNAATLVMSGTSGTFNIPSTSLATAGTTTLTISAITSSTGCNTTVSSGNTSTITVDPLPADVTVSGSGAYCGSGTLTAANGSSGVIYYQGTTSLGTSTVTPSTSQTISTNGTYYFRARSAGGCWGDEGSGTITINTLPTVVSVSGGGTFCGSATLTASNGGSGTIYYQGTNATDTSTASPGASKVVSASGTYYFRALSGTGCWGPAGSATVTINPLPNSIDGTLKTCISGTTTLSNTSGGGTWASSTTSVATIGSGTGVVNGVATGTSTITYRLTTGCTINAVVSVATTPAAIGGASAVCAGSTITLTDATNYGAWSSSNAAVATVGSTGIVTGTGNGTVVITYTTGCGTAATKTVTVGNAPITGTLSACTSATSALSDAVSGGTWSSSSTSIATVGSSSGIVTGQAAGTATISYTSGSCVSTAVFTVNAAPAAIGGTAAVCVGATTTLTDATLYGTWSSAATSVATIGSTGIVTGVTGGTATISYSTGCGTPATKVVTVNTPPATIGGSLTVCVGSNTTLSGAGGGTWVSSTTTIGTIGSTTGILSGIAAGATTLTYTLSTGCYTTSVATVNALPAAITGTGVVCVGSTTTLNSTTSGGTWSSNNTSLATVGTTGTITGVGAGNPVVSYTLGTGCSVNKTVTVNPLPSAISGTAAVCVSATTTLTSSGSGTWTSSSTTQATVGSGTGVVTGVAAGTSVISYTLGTGCKVTKVVTVNALPFAINGVSIVCVGATATFTDAGGGSWASSNTGIATIGTASGIATGVAAGTTTVSYILATGCSATKTLTVAPLPVAGTITGSSEVCESDVVIWTETEATGTWSSDNDGIASIDADGEVLGVSDGATIISYTVTNICGTVYTSKAITVNPLPFVDTIAGSSEICTGNTTSLTNTGPGGTWTSDNSLVATIDASTGLLTAVAAGEVGITYTVSNGCGSDLDDITVTVNTSPAAVTGTTRICGTNTSTLADGTSGGTWSSSTTAVGTVGSTTGTVRGISPGTTTITYLLSNGCKATAVVTVAGAPSLTSATNSGPICAGVTLTLTANAPSNIATYQWSGPVAITNSTTASASVPSATTAASGTYTVAIANGSGVGCSGSYTTAATVNSTPIAAPVNNGPVCAGGSATLTATPSGGATTYTWSGPGLSSTTAQNPVATPTATTTYSLTVTNGTAYAGCSPATIYTTTVSWFAAPTAAPTNTGPLCNASSATLSANPAGSTNTYTWTGPNLSSTTVQNPTASPTVTSTYSLTVRYTGGNSGCSPTTVYTTAVTVIPGGNNWLGTVSNDWFTAGNWCGGVPTTTMTVTIPSGTPFSPRVTAGTAAVKNITVAASATLTVTGGTFQVSGSITTTGTFSVTGGTIEMNGSAAQSIAAGTFAGNTINNLTLSNAAGLSLTGAMKVRGIVKPATGNIAANGNLTLLSTSSQTALVDGSGSGTITGNTTVERYVARDYGYKYVSSPFTSLTVGAFGTCVDLSASFPTFYYYNESLATAGWVTYTTTASTLAPLSGYAANFGTSSSPITVSVSGVVNNGALSTTLYNRNRTYTLGFNLVGNPYPSPIDWNASSGWTKTNIDNAVYYFNASDTNQYTGTYSSYVAGVSSDGVANNIIPAMQGFFVHVSNGSYPVTGTFGMNNSVRVTTLNPAFHKATNSSVSLLRLQAGYTSATLSDPTVVYFNDDSKGIFDPERDALKLMNTDSTLPNLYTLSKDDNKLSIHAVRAVADSIEVVPLGVQLPEAGRISMSMRSLENVSDDLHLFLYDASARVVRDLRNEPIYQVTLDKGSHDSRFFLMITRKNKADLPIGNGAINAYTSGGSLFMHTLTNACDVTVSDLLGRTIGQYQLTGSGYHEIKLQVASGIYLATFNSDLGRQSMKISIFN